MNPYPVVEAAHGDYTISSDYNRLDFAAIHQFLTRVYWSVGISHDLIERGARGALCFGIYHASGQVGYARVITDAATFAYLCDVYVLEEHRGRGLSKAMMRCIMDHPSLQGLRRFVLATKNAHSLYEQFGFQAVASPESYMEILKRDPYLNLSP